MMALIQVFSAYYESCSGPGLGETEKHGRSVINITEHPQTPHVSKALHTSVQQ